MPSELQLLRMPELEPGVAEVLPSPPLDGYAEDTIRPYALIKKFYWPRAYRLHGVCVMPQVYTDAAAAALAVQFRDEFGQSLCTSGFRADQAPVNAICNERDFCPLQLQVKAGDVWQSILASTTATPGRVVYLFLVSPP